MLTLKKSMMPKIIIFMNIKNKMYFDSECEVTQNFSFVFAKNTWPNFFFVLR